MQIVKIVKQGEQIPAWYGVAWVHFMRHESTCLPLPVNLVAAFFRFIYIWMRHGWKDIPVSPLDAYYQGHNEAYGEMDSPPAIKRRAKKSRGWDTDYL